ncbi:unnamed protein product, partial [Ectocarpus sp. 13 AM-2016]
FHLDTLFNTPPQSVTQPSPSLSQQRRDLMYRSRYDLSTAELDSRTSMQAIARSQRLAARADKQRQTLHVGKTLPPIVTTSNDIMTHSSSPPSSPPAAPMDISIAQATPLPTATMSNPAPVKPEAAKLPYSACPPIARAFFPTEEIWNGLDFAVQQTAVDNDAAAAVAAKTAEITAAKHAREAIHRQQVERAEAATADH